MIYEHCRDGFDRAPEQNVNDTAWVTVLILHGADKESTAFRRIIQTRQDSALRVLVLASLCSLAAIPAPVVTSVASNLRITVNGDKVVVLSWTGTPGVLYQAHGASGFCYRIADWQAIDVPTASSSMTSIRTSPAEFYRVGIFTN